MRLCRLHDQPAAIRDGEFKFDKGRVETVRLSGGVLRDGLLCCRTNARENCALSYYIVYMLTVLSIRFLQRTLLFRCLAPTNVRRLFLFP
jgi:hypothetical protein